LESGDFKKAYDEKLIDYDPFILEYMKTMRTSPGKYSEMYVDSPFASGIFRLTVDPYSYYIYTSSPAEIAEIEKSVFQEKITYDEAIKRMVEKYG
jgi:conjugal transfer ATP-binding protein TraC